MATETKQFTQGAVTSRDESTLQPGELKVATGCWYKPGDTESISKVGGRSTFGDTGSAAEVKGIALAQFDDAQDRVIALSGTTLYTAPAGATGTPITLESGLSSSNTGISAAHYDDKTYLALGYDRDRVIGSNGSIRSSGMLRPSSAPTVAVHGDVASAVYPSTITGGVNGASVIDGRDDTAGGLQGSSGGGTSMAASGWASNTAIGRKLIWRIRMDGAQYDNGTHLFGVAGATPGTSGASLFLQYTETGGFPFYLLQFPTVTAISTGVFEVQVSLTDGLNSANVQARLFLIDGPQPISTVVFWYAVKIWSAGQRAVFTTIPVTDGGGFVYATSEYDSNENKESAISELSGLVTMASQSWNTVTRASTQNSTRATHWILYRTPDGFQDKGHLGRVDFVSIAQTTYSDVFTKDKDTQLTPLLDLLRVSAAEGELVFDRNIPPPSHSYLTSWRGSLVGLSNSEPRTLSYSEAGSPESWPEIYVVTSFPIPEHDILVALQPVGDSLVIACQDAILVMNSLPRASDGITNFTDVSPLRGQPGCVSSKAMVGFSVSGEPRAAWISRFGVHMTNGLSSQKISADMDWSNDVSVGNLSTATLHWDKNRLVLIMAYDATGAGYNNRLAFFHMSPEHQKENGMPKATWPHYGRVNQMASGIVSGAHRLYSAHVSDGIVYLENSGGADSSQSYSSTQNPMILTADRAYRGWKYYSVYRGGLSGRAWSTGDSATISWEFFQDASNVSDVVSQSVSLAGSNRSEFYVGRAGESSQMTITHTGTGTGDIISVEMDIMDMGQSGRVSA